MSEEILPCPFVYKDGRQCCGNISHWRAYGWREGEPLYFAKKVRLWCSEKDDHADCDRSFAAKERMEFYPNRLSSEIYAKIEAAGHKEATR